MENNEQFLKEPQEISIEEIEGNVAEIDATPTTPVSTSFTPEALSKYDIDGQFSLVNNEGEAIYVAEDQLQAALTNPGWGLETKKQHNDRREYEQKALDLDYYSSGNNKLFAQSMALLNTVTGGWSEIGYVAADEFGEKTGLWDFDNEEYAAIKEANAKTTIAGEIGGLLNPWGWLNKPAKAINWATKAAFKKVVQESGEAGFKKWGTKVLEKGTVGFLEHQVYQAKSYVNESLLSNVDMNAESFFANQKDGSGWAFLIGGAIGGLPAVASAGKRGLGKARGSLNKLLGKSKPSTAADDLFRSTVNTGDSAIQNAKPGVARDIVQDTVAEYGENISQKQLLKHTEKYSKRLDESYDDIIKKADEGTEGFTPDVEAANASFLSRSIDELEVIASGHPDAKRLIGKLDEIAEYANTNIPTTTAGLKNLSDDIAKIKDADELIEQFAKQTDSEILNRLDDVAKDNIDLINTKRKVIEEFSTGLKKAEPAEKSLFSLEGIGGDLFTGVVFDAIDGDLDLKEFLLGFGAGRLKSVGAKLLRNSMKSSALKYFKSQQVIDLTEEAIQSSVKKSLFSSTSGVSASAGFLSQTIFPNLPKGASKEDKIEYLTIRLDEYGSKTDMLEQRTIAGVESFNDTMPETAKGVMDRQVKMVEFLKGKIPRDPRSETMDLMNKFNKREWKPSKYQIREFEKYLSASVAPMTVFEDIGKGRVSVQQMEALQVLYPEMYKYMTFSVINEVASSTKPIPYSNRIKLSLVMGMPLDSSLEPATIRALQLLGTPQEKQPDTGMVSSVAPKLKPTQKGLNKLKIASRANSTLDAALNRGLE